jgi:hypothetical protein
MVARTFSRAIFIREMRCVFFKSKDQVFVDYLATLRTSSDKWLISV